MTISEFRDVLDSELTRAFKSLLEKKIATEGLPFTSVQAYFDHVKKTNPNLIRPVCTPLPGVPLLRSSFSNT